MRVLQSVQSVSQPCEFYRVCGGDAEDQRELRARGNNCPGRKIPKGPVKRPVRHTKPPCKIDLLRGSLRSLKRPGLARTGGHVQQLRHAVAAGRRGARDGGGGVVGREAKPRQLDLGCGRIVASEIEAPNMLVHLVVQSDNATEP